MKKLLSTAVVSAAALALIGTASVAPASAASTPTITVATEGTYAPFSFHATANGPLTGYDVDVIKAVAAKAGLKVQFKETTWDTIFAGLEAKRFDFIANQVTVTDARKAKYQFSVPYTVDREVVVARKDSKITKPSDISGLTAAQSATSNHRAEAEKFGAKIEVVPGFTESLALVTAQRVDVTLNSQLAVLEYLANNKNSNLKIAATFTAADNQALVSLPGNKYAAKVNAALKALIANGTIAKLGKKYFGADVTK
ncbi:MAG: transporter substrate-binding domain-containing protein [Rhodoluna sp.]